MDKKKIGKQHITTFEQAVEYLNATPRFTTKNEMQDTRAFLKRLGNPEKKMRIIHVAGTNGKGSVCAYLRSILEEAGYTVAVFTSPHLVDIRERFVVNGEMISKEEFLRAFLQIYEMLDWESVEDCREMDNDASDKFYHPTFFEYLFFMAMILFPNHHPDFCILETGLGGRLDATNAVETKDLAVITRIGLDHVEYLGDTLSKIAGEKAGIMHPDAPVVYWETTPEVDDVFSRYAQNLGISAHKVSKKDIKIPKKHGKTIDFSVATRYYNYISLSLQTIAEYQMENVALAVRAVELLDLTHTLTKEQIQDAVHKCHWAGRMEEVLPEVYVDGAHNEDGIRAFLETVAADGHKGPRSLLFSAVKDKDYEHMAQKVAASNLFQKIVIAHMSTGRATELERLQKLFEEKCSCPVEGYDSVALAFDRICRERGEAERIYVAGSLYLVGEIKELLL